MSWGTAASSQAITPTARRGLLRVCVVGPESTGKTTLACRLAEHYDTLWVREYARIYSTDKLAVGQGPWWDEEFLHIARTQRRFEAQAERGAGGLLFFDTDAFAVWVWHRLYARRTSKALEMLVEATRADHYLLTKPDLPFVDDGIRDGALPRDRIYELYRSELERTGRRYVEISGTAGARLSTAIEAVDDLVAEELVASHR